MGILFGPSNHALMFLMPDSLSFEAVWRYMPSSESLFPMMVYESSTSTLFSINLLSPFESGSMYTLLMFQHRSPFFFLMIMSAISSGVQLTQYSSMQ